MSHCQHLWALVTHHPSDALDSFRDQLYTRAAYQHMLALSISAWLYFEVFGKACHTAYRLVKSEPDNKEYSDLMLHCMEEYRMSHNSEWEPSAILTAELDYLYLDPESPFQYLQE